MNLNVIGSVVAIAVLAVVARSVIGWSSSLEAKTEGVALISLPKQVEKSSEQPSLTQNVCIVQEEDSNGDVHLVEEVVFKVNETEGSQDKSVPEPIQSEIKELPVETKSSIQKLNKWPQSKILAEADELKKGIRGLAFESRNTLEEMKTCHEKVMERAIDRVSQLEKEVCIKIDAITEKVREKERKSDQLVFRMNITAQFNSIRKIFFESVAEVLSQFAISREIQEKYSVSVRKYISLL